MSETGANFTPWIVLPEMFLTHSKALEKTGIQDVLSPYTQLLRDRFQTHHDHDQGKVVISSYVACGTV